MTTSEILAILATNQVGNPRSHPDNENKNIITYGSIEVAYSLIEEIIKK